MTNNQVYNNQIVINNQKPINQTGLGIGNWLLKFIWSLGFGYWLLFFITLCLFASPAAQAAVGPNYIEQWGITWTFDKPITDDKNDPDVLNGNKYLWGKFVNDDYWVVGPVRITQITPAWDGEKHGSVINPPSTYNTQGYSTQKRINGCSYDSFLTANLPGKMPIQLTANQSLVSTIGNVSGQGGRSMIKSAQVLTCLGAVPPEDAFRPAYISNEKSIFRLSQIDRSLLPNLPTVPAAPNPIDEYESHFKGALLDHMYAVAAQAVHPSDYMRDYNPARGLVTAPLLLMINDSRNEQLLRAYLQFGIDQYYILKYYLLDPSTVGKKQIWNGFGGHGAGRKIPILFAAAMFNNSEMKSLLFRSGDSIYSEGHKPGDLKPGSVVFSEDEQTFYARQHPDAGAVWSCNGASCFSNGTDQDYDIFVPNPLPVISDCNGNTDCLAGYKFNYTANSINIYGHGNLHGGQHPPNEYFEYLDVHRGIPEYGISHATGGDGGEPALVEDGLSWAASYRDINSLSFSSAALVALMMEEKAGTRTLWNRNAFFSYTDRWVEVEPSPTYKHSPVTNTFITNMWNTYRDHYGCRWTRDDQSPCTASDLDNPSSSCYSNGHYICDGALVRCEWQASTCSNCTLIEQASDYPNQRARDYDPCQVCSGAAIIYGDVSGDSVLSAYDAALCARIAVGLDAYPTGDNLTKADVSGDGFVMAYDAALIAQKAVGLITKFPVES